MAQHPGNHWGKSGGSSQKAQKVMADHAEEHSGVSVLE